MTEDEIAAMRARDAMLDQALLLLLGAAGLFVTRTPDVMHHASRVGVVGTR